MFILLLFIGTLQTSLTLETKSQTLERPWDVYGTIPTMILSHSSENPIYQTGVIRPLIPTRP